jgi:hypothetical protein
VGFGTVRDGVLLNHRDTEARRKGKGENGWRDEEEEKGKGGY